MSVGEILTYMAAHPNCIWVQLSTRRALDFECEVVVTLRRVDWLQVCDPGIIMAVVLDTDCGD